MNLFQKALLITLVSIAACDVLKGPKGDKGDKGDPGTDGVAGFSCTVVQLEASAQIQCDDGTVAVVQNGEDGEDAELEFVDPCPENVVSYPELLMLFDNIYYGVYASGSKVHWVRLRPGVYVTTDGRACNFTINSSGQLQ